ASQTGITGERMNTLDCPTPKVWQVIEESGAELVILARY
ncbi:hypothetical protein PSYMO_37117, partial [Pseudomonas amygdali pv. mori str. 301020]